MLRTGIHSSARRRRGFSLLELILVLAILGLAAAAVAPSLVHFARHRRMLDAAAMLLAMTQQARGAAASDGTPWRLHVDGSANELWLESQRDGDFAESGKRVAIAADVRIEWEKIAGEAADRGFVAFEADGSHDAAAWELTDADGRSVRVVGEVEAEGFRVTGGEL